MTTANIQSLKGLGIIRKADAVASAQKPVMAIISGRWLMAMLRARRTRRHLAGLSDHLLADIGLTEDQRQAELQKPFWKIQGPGR
jgi:uncharacterized protein YjiS (DUF1127 family)